MCGDKIFLSQAFFFSDYHRKNKKNRPGLQLLNSLYEQLITIRAQYSEPSASLHYLVDSLVSDLTKRWVTDDPWDLARKVFNLRFGLYRACETMLDVGVPSDRSFSKKLIFFEL